MFARIALNVPLRRVFDYRVPPDLAGEVLPGVRVMVPFGGRRLSGVVVELTDRSDVAPSRLKSLASVVDEAPLFTPEQLNLAKWVADYYFCGWGEVLEAGLPSGLGVRLMVRYRWRAGASPTGVEGLSPGVRALVDQSPRTGGDGDGWSLSDWKKAGPTPADDRWLAARRRSPTGVETLWESAGLRRQVPMEKWVEPGPLMEAAPRGRPNRMTETKAEKILRLMRQEGAVPMDRIKALMAAPGPVVRGLAEKGMVTVVDKPKPEGRDLGDLPPPEDFLPLNPEQQAVADPLFRWLEQGANGQPVGSPREGGYQGVLLEGVTGSGKTEVYLHLVRKTLSLGKSCLILVPEIALTAQMVNRFRSRFGDQVAVLHSAMGEARRFAEWNRVRRGAAPIVVGARSALFAPLQNLGLVVVDEEHDPSYKQDDTPRYQARDTALVRARFNGALAVLGSATPSMESLRNAALGKLVHLVLSHRVNNRPLPRVELLHLKAVPRQPGSLLFTRTLVEAIRQNLLKKEQTLIFLNRRGFANLVRCEACQEPVVCPNCSLTLVYHQARESLRCHRCDHQQPHPVQCPACRGGPMKVLGVGTERLEEELGVMFPQARLLRMDSDSLSRRGELERLLEGIRLNRYDIIIGTQILTKGHDFPNISLVAAVLADLSLNLPDFRAGERTFQLLTQMAGRAGRGSIPGQVLIQTYNPLHHSLVHVQTHDTAGFTRVELPIREKSGAPPYTHQAMVWVSGPDEAKTLALARQVGFLLQRHSPAGVLVMGPAEPPIRKVAGRYRQMVALRHPQPGALLRGLKSALEDPVLKPGPNQRIVVDMDAHNLM